MKIQIENLKAKMSGGRLNIYQKADAKKEFNKFIDYVNELEPYFESAYEVDLSGMDEDVFDAYFSAKKRACEDEQERVRLEEEAKKEAERVNALRVERKEKVIHLWNFIPDYVKESDFAEIEEFDALIEELELKKSNYDKEQENIRKENERLQKEAKVKENRDKARNEELKHYITFIRDYNKMLNLPDSDYKKEFEDIKKGASDHWEHERKEQIKKAHEEEQKRVNEERAEIDRKAKERKLKAEKDEAERELKEAQEAERKRLALVELNKQNELNKGDADKVKDLIADLEALKTKYTFKSEKNRKKYAGVSRLIDKVVTYINE